MTSQIYALDNKKALKRTTGPILQRQCACGNHSHSGRECESCKKKKQENGNTNETGILQREAINDAAQGDVPQVIYDTLRAPGQPLDEDIRDFMGQRFRHNFSGVRVHTDAQAAESAQAVNALAYTVGQDVVFDQGQYAPGTADGKQLLAHELTHVVQQSSRLQTRSALAVENEGMPEEQNAQDTANAISSGQPVGIIARVARAIQRRAAPYIKKVSVHLAPPQSADLEWVGTPPADATGSDHFTVSTGKGYSDPGDPAGTCTRTCCRDADTQCAPPWNRPGRVGACCTFHGSNYWTGTPREEHNTWKWWTPIQPYYSQRGIALHQHHTVTGQPIGHGCVRMQEPNAKRIFDYSNGRRTKVAIDGRAAPVQCEASQRCAGGSGTTGSLETEGETTSMLAQVEGDEQNAVAGLEGVMS